jgi:hypothetical protein
MDRLSLILLGGVIILALQVLVIVWIGFGESRRAGILKLALYIPLVPFFVMLSPSLHFLAFILLNAN